MWCEHCQTEVASQISDDGRSLQCTSCGKPIQQVFAPSLHPETQSARKLLEQWAKEQQALRPADQPPAPPKPAPSPPEQSPSLPDAGPQKSQATGPAPWASENHDAPPKTDTLPLTEDLQSALDELHRLAAAKKSSEKGPLRSGSTNSQPPQNDEEPEIEKPLSGPASRGAHLRLDSGHGRPSGPTSSRSSRPRRPKMLERAAQASSLPPESPPPTETESRADESPRKRRRRDDVHAGVPNPHFDVTVNAPRKAYPGRSETIWGQLLAYGGVGLLTVGTVLVLWGYFGKIENYASTGWLIATAGQMLLLLGVVTLVSGGMQQTTHEVTQRIEFLGGRMVRIEESTEKLLKGPRRRRSRQRARAAETPRDENRDRREDS